VLAHDRHLAGQGRDEHGARDAGAEHSRTTRPLAFCCRTSERNLGGPHRQIAIEMHMLIGDVPMWVDSTAADEVCVRLSHRAVVIHPFPDGNGRWSRTLADSWLDHGPLRRFARS
jgi:fido (protein-threonine AMPylation protein)